MRLCFLAFESVLFPACSIATFHCLAAGVLRTQQGTASARIRFLGALLVLALRRTYVCLILEEDGEHPSSARYADLQGICLASGEIVRIEAVPLTRLRATFSGPSKNLASAMCLSSRVTTISRNSDLRTSLCAPPSCIMPVSCCLPSWEQSLVTWMTRDTANDRG